jgi:hypothetical protein
MTGWHVDESSLVRYARGDAAVSLAASVEAHLVACADCRLRLAPAVDLPRLAAVWDGVVDRVDTPPAGVVERLLRRARISEDTARLLAATPSLRASFLLAMAAVLGFATLASGQHRSGTVLFLVVAPMLPVAGVAAAFQRGLDPAHEISVAAPYSGFRLLLLRALAVVGVTCVAAGGAGALLADRALTAAAWLLPALALTTLTLALSRWVEAVPAAAVVGVAWLAVLAAVGSIADGASVAFGPAGQVICALVAVAAALVLLAHRDRYATPLGGA